MFCPQCESEYREGIASCTECGVALVAQPRDHGDDPQFTKVLRTNNQPLLMAFRAALEAADIPHVVRGDEASHLIAVDATVVVPREHLDAARELLDQLEKPSEPDEDDPDDPITP